MFEQIGNIFNFFHFEFSILQQVEYHGCNPYLNKLLSELFKVIDV